MSLGDGRQLHAPTPFPGDDGRPDPVLRAALDSGDGDAVLDRLQCGVRLLVPVVAVLEEAGDDGRDKASHMASVSLVQSDGRRGLLAFTSAESLRAWDREARPVPARAIDVAVAAIAEGADGVLVDIAGPVRFALDGEALRLVAAGGGEPG